jgi:GT2 family glycosyltransferase
LAQGADFIWIVDNDALVAPNTLTAMMTAQQQEPPAAVLTPKVLFFSQPDMIWSMGYDCRPLTLARIHSWEGQAATSAAGPRRAATYAPCCGLLVRRDVFSRVGFLDTDYFIYYEDLDFCLRMRRAGCQLYSVPEATMWHKVSASAGEGSPLQKYHLARSSVRFYRKHTAWWLYPVIFLYRLGSALRTTWRAWRQRRPDVIRAYWRGLCTGCRDLIQQRT